MKAHPLLLFSKVSTLNVDPTRRPISCLRLTPPGPSTPPCLLAAGHDSILRLYDFRIPTSSRATLSYSFLNPLTSPITALAVCPTNALSCVLGLENGTIGWVDWRKGNRMIGRKFSEHGDGGVVSLDWKEGGREGELGEGRSEGGWIASGGLDRKVYVRTYFHLSLDGFLLLTLTFFHLDLQQCRSVQSQVPYTSYTPSSR